MAGFLYYFPNRQEPLSRNHFSDDDRKCGLDLLLRDASIAYTEYAAGPDQGRGSMAMAVDNGGAEQVLYDPDVQRWLQVNPHYWVGMYTDDRRPTPADLARSKMVDGEAVEIAGCSWVIPVCGPIISKLPLSFQYVLNGSGWEWKSEVKKEWLWLQEAAKDVLERIRPDGEADAMDTFRRHMDFCAKLFGVNYRLDRLETSMLELIDSETFMQIIFAAIGKLTIERAEGKQQAAATTNT